MPAVRIQLWSGTATEQSPESWARSHCAALLPSPGKLFTRSSGPEPGRPARVPLAGGSLGGPPLFRAQSSFHELESSRRHFLNESKCLQATGLSSSRKELISACGGGPLPPRHPHDVIPEAENGPPLPTLSETTAGLTDRLRVRAPSERAGRTLPIGRRRTRSHRLDAESKAPDHASAGARCFARRTPLIHWHSVRTRARA